MGAAAHINALSEKHAILEQRIDEEEHRPAPDEVVLHELKREKLRLKDEIERFRHS
ncbi:YdcH family protein [Emcibacter sp.]|uniref:YdcH family protein n=1 Tax=Emcibacter sp. TaxID=1979954 RepID=UPI002AA91A54|nr:YdcH family protein [Emcibacter sp.]